ncbi:lipoprotein-releasing system ATP-binding protein LolD [Planctomycetota bacterium]|nr:lipoprotein-releasing system ATP-binding protein LolD [Planctomycetota bacterium]
MTAAVPGDAAPAPGDAAPEPGEATPELLAVRGLTKRHGDEPPIFAGLDLDLAAGAAIAITGPSGCGKSTLLACLGGLERPTAGTVRFAGVDLATLTADAAAAQRAEQIGFVFQEHHLLPQLGALDNVLLPTLALRRRPPRAECESAARHLLDQVGLAGKEHRLPSQLSGGERQRVAVARALINRPRLVLADEPTGALDPVHAAAVAELLVALNRDHGAALIVVTHAAAVAARLPRRWSLADGRLREVV